MGIIKKLFFIQILTICMVVCGLCFSVFSQVPNKISYQGKLTDQYGVPINSASVEMTFILKDSDGNQTWTEDRTVSVVYGHFSVELGEVTPITYDLIPTSAVSLEVEIDGTSLPDINLQSSPYTFQI